MKSLKKFFNSLTGSVDIDNIKDYDGHAIFKHGHHDHSPNRDNKHQPDIKYACPMKCEGDKVYDKPGDCPVCNMHLVSMGV